MAKFAGPDIYDRNTFLMRMNEQTLMSRVKKDQLFWLYKHAEEALFLHASTTDRTPLAAFNIPVSEPHLAPEGSAAAAASYASLAEYFAAVKKYLVDRDTESTDQSEYLNSNKSVMSDEIEALKSRFPSLQVRTLPFVVLSLSLTVRSLSLAVLLPSFLTVL